MEASSINQPHENEAPVVEAPTVDDFFGDGGTPVEVEEPSSSSPPAANAIDDFDAEPPHDPAAEVTEPEPVATEPELDGTTAAEADREPAGDEVAEPIVTDVPETEAQEPQPPAAPLDPAVEPPEPEPEAGAKAAPRDYLVFQEMVLTERMLKTLLEEFKTSSDPEPRKVYYVISKEEKHTAIAALESAYTTHKDALGEEATLVPVTAKKWQPRHIKPKVKTRVSLDIS